MPQKCASLVRDSLRHGRREVDLFTESLPNFPEPHPGVGAVNHAPQKAEPLGGIVAVSPNVVLRDLCVQGKKAIHAPGLGKYISRVAKLRGFDDHCFLYVEDVLIPKQIDSARAA